MQGTVNESTEALLNAFGTDLQRQLARTATVERLLLQEAPGMITLIATVRVGTRELEFAGRGENVLAAYADLGRRAPVAVISSAFRQLVDA